MMRAELTRIAREHPTVVNIEIAARALGIGRTLAYELLARGEFPVKTLRLGARTRVVTADLLRVLEVDLGQPRPLHVVRPGSPAGGDAA